MDKLPAASPQPRKCETPSQMSSRTFKAAIQALEHDDWHTAARSVTPAEATAVLAEMEGRDTRCTDDEAVAFAGQLVNFYPAREVHDARTYIAGLSAVMAAYPRDFVKRVCSPISGIPGRLKFLPTIAEVQDALIAEAERRKRIAANARYVLELEARRKEQAEEDARWTGQRPTAEERARQVQALLQGAARPL